MFAGIGSMQALVPPQMIEIDAVGAIAILQLKRSITPMSAASGHGPRSTASCIEASSTWALMCLNILRFHDFAIAPSNGSPRAWRKLWKPITPRPTERSRLAEYLAFSMPGSARSI
jgi:hypothetical protein